MPKPTTPPNSQHTSVILALSDTTPLKRDLPGTEAHTSTPVKRASERYLDMTFDICNKFVGPMPVKDFLEEFVPHAPTPRPQGEFPFHQSRVSQNENKFIAAIRDSGLCPDLQFKNTTCLPSKIFRNKPDISAISCTPDPDSASGKKWEFHWGIVELWIENKRKEDDPFIGIEELQRNPQATCHVDWTNSAYKTCGQLIEYATSHHRSQFRVFSFSVVVIEDTFRLLRWDRSGIIYTAPSKLADECLFEFLWRFNHLSPVDRGHDTTVCPADDNEAELALPKLRTYPKFENVRKEHLHRILVWDDRSPDDAPRRYITPSAKWATQALIGRATFGYIAFDIERGELVYLKDFWRVDHPEIQKEGDVYRELHEAEVRNVAKMGRAGDVRSTINDGQVRVPAGVQRTRPQDYLDQPWCPGRPVVEPYVHYRLVLETVGMPLNRFKSTRQLCEVIRDAIVAHTDACNKTRILHRDVSAGNILITEEGTGILIDWDLSKKVKENADVQPRRHSRTGTWQFISIGRLLDPYSRPHEVSDDLESFFWVLVYEVVRYRNDKGIDLEDSMKRVFDWSSQPDKSGFVKGGDGKIACVGGTKFSPVIIETLVETPCRAIIEEIRSVFNDLYLYMEAVALDLHTQSRIAERRKNDPRVEHARKKLQTSGEFLSIFEKHLGTGWEISDDGSLDLTEPRADPSASRNRLKRNADDGGDEGENWHVFRIGRYPPKPTLRRSAVDDHSTQTSITSSHDNSPFSTSRDMPSSSLISSGGLQPRKDGPQEEQ